MSPTRTCGSPLVLVPHLDGTRARAVLELTLVLVPVLVPRCYRCPRDHHGRQVDFRLAGHVTCLGCCSSVSPFSAYFSSTALGSFPQPGMSVPVSVPGLGLLAQPSSLPILFPCCGSILPPHVRLASFSQCRPSSSSTSCWEGSARSSSPLSPWCSGGRRVGGRRRLLFPCPHTCVGGVGAASAVGSIGDGRFGGRASRHMSDLVLRFSWRYSIT